MFACFDLKSVNLWVEDRRGSIPGPAGPCTNHLKFLLILSVFNVSLLVSFATSGFASASTSSEVAAFKATYPDYSVAELLVKAADGDSLAHLELALRHSTGASGAPKTQRGSLNRYRAAAQLGAVAADSSLMPVNQFGVPVIRVDRDSQPVTGYASPSSILLVSTLSGAAPLTVNITTEYSQTYNSSIIRAVSSRAAGELSGSYLSDQITSSITYSSAGTYQLRLIVMDDQGEISIDTKTITVTSVILPVPPSWVVISESIDSTLRYLAWEPSGNADLFDVRLVSASGAELARIADLNAASTCTALQCTVSIPAGWNLENGAGIEIRAGNDNGESVWVSSGNAPIANAGPDRGLAAGSTLALDGSFSIDRDGAISSYQWIHNGNILASGSMPTVQLPVGEQTVSLVVTDNDGYTSTDTLKVHVFAPRTVSIGSNVGDVEKILDNLTVSKSQINVQMSPVATGNGYLYTANIEHGPNGDQDGVTLRTIVRKGWQQTNGNWSWDDVLVEHRTVYDEWHTAPSIITDRDGMVHVVYNMHNIPWQYKRTALPHDIDSFEFRGQAVTQAQINNWKFNNSTSFPSLGHADIPGTQITYPRFTKDYLENIYISYRFAARPARNWPDRTFSAGVAEYSTRTNSWSAIGESLPVTSADFQYHADAPVQPTPFAAKINWTAYHPQVVFNQQSGMGVFMLWRSGTAGARTSRPCFAWSDNKQDFETMAGSSLSLPLLPSNCSNLGFSSSVAFYNNADSDMDSQGNPYLVLSPESAPRELLSFKQATQTWHSEALPSNASEIFLDHSDNLWAVSSGPTIYKRAAGSTTWTLIYSEGGSTNCYPKAVVSEDGGTAFIHTQNCNWGTVSIYGLRLKP